MKRQILLCLLFCLGAVVVFAAASRARAQEFQARIYTNAAGDTLPYRLLVPEHYEPAKRYPLVLFFHGAGERGSDNRRQLVHGVRLFLQPENREKFPCFVIAPQCPQNQQWVDMPWGTASGTQPEHPSHAMQLALDIAKAVQKEFSIDPDRLYVTGLSMGGFATWDLITRFPHRYAAAIPVCGGGDAAKAALAAHVPVWAFHSKDDPVVQVGRTRQMIEAMREAGGKPRYTEYDGLGHNSWDKAYAEPDLLSWLFSHRRTR